MTIDWMNPSRDAEEARRIGYNEGLNDAEAREDEHELWVGEISELYELIMGEELDTESDPLESLRVAIEEVLAERTGLRDTMGRLSGDVARLREALSEIAHSGTSMPAAYGDEVSWYRNLAFGLIRRAAICSAEEGMCESCTGAPTCPEFAAGRNLTADGTLVTCEGYQRKLQ